MSKNKTGKFVITKMVYGVRQYLQGYGGKTWDMCKTEDLNDALAFLNIYQVISWYTDPIIRENNTLSDTTIMRIAPSEGIVAVEV